MAPPLLAVEGLNVERGGRLVLSDLELTLGAGETILVAGRNGTGKSTLLRTLAGLLHPAAGTIRYGLADDEVRGVETAHYLGYEDALKPSLTVRENLAFWAAMLGLSASARRGSEAAGCRRGLGASPSTADAAAAPPTMSRVAPRPPFTGEDLSVSDALSAYGIARLIDLPAGYLSAGQKRRVALARLLLAARPVWLLDEPLIALDAAAQAIVVALMAAHTAAGGAILVASHQPIAASRIIALDAAV